jgi:glycosyltransferase involved in cell wall biosynthesis
MASPVSTTEKNIPSFAEGMPMILTEALAGARPFVATPVGGTPEIASEPNMLVPVGDPLASAVAIGRYLRDPDLGDGLRVRRTSQRLVAPKSSTQSFAGSMRGL